MNTAFDGDRLPDGTTRYVVRVYLQSMLLSMLTTHYLAGLFVLIQQYIV